MHLYRLAIVGLGHCTRWHVKAIKTLPDMFILVGVHDLNFDKQKCFSEIKFFSNLDNLLKQNIDCVVLATPSPTKYGLAKTILKSNKNLFAEKPFVKWRKIGQSKIIRKNS